MTNAARDPAEARPTGGGGWAARALLAVQSARWVLLAIGAALAVLALFTAQSAAVAACSAALLTAALLSIAAKCQEPRAIAGVSATLSPSGSGELELFRGLTQNFPAAIVVRDRNGRIVRCSRYAEFLFGYAVDQIVGASEDFFLTITHEDDIEAARRTLLLPLSEGIEYSSIVRMYTRRGVERWIETRTVPLKNELGEVSSTLSVLVDVTGYRLQERQLKDRNRDLQDFTYMISHDLKAPIFTIKGMAQLIRDDFKGKIPPDLDELLTHISAAASTLEKLVQSVLEYARITTLEPTLEAVPLNEVLSDVVRDYASAISEKHAAIDVGALPAVRGERVRIYQIFSNLVGNALKYSAADRPPVISIEAEEGTAGRDVTIAVRDNGQGIAAEKLEVIFRPFQRAHGREVEGLGIGLACVKKLSEQAGGGVSVESTPGSGSCFKVRLMLATP